MYVFGLHWDCRSVALHILTPIIYSYIMGAESKNHIDFCKDGVATAFYFFAYNFH